MMDSFCLSTKTQHRAFLDKDSKPREPEPANKSKQDLFVKSWPSQLNNVSLTLPRVGLTLKESAKKILLFLSRPA